MQSVMNKKYYDIINTNYTKTSVLFFIPTGFATIHSPTNITSTPNTPNITGKILFNIQSSITCV